VPLPLLRIRSTGLGQSVGEGFNVSSMRKSPFGSSGTPVKRPRGFTEQRGEDALVGILADGIAVGQEQAAPSDLDTTVGVDVGSEIGDPPGPGGSDSSHDVELYIRKRSIGVRGPGSVGHGNDANPAFESGQEITPVGLDLTHNSQSQ
jgi:hypothetical protein